MFGLFLQTFQDDVKPRTYALVFFLNFNSQHTKTSPKFHTESEHISITHRSINVV